MKKKYWKYVILMAIFLCMIFGCGKKEGSEEEAGKEKATEITAAIDEPDVFEEDGSGQIQEIQEDSEQNLGEEPEQNTLDELNLQLSEVLQQIYTGGAAASVYVEDLSTGVSTVLSHQQMQSASLIKLYIAGCVYEHMDEMKTQESYEGETEELLRSMISVSDNDAANTLTSRLGYGDAAAGRAAVNQYCQSYGYTDTYMGRMMLEFTSAEDNYTSASDCGKFLERLYRQEFAGSEEILACMKQQERTGKLPAGVPEGVVTANKTGELSDVENDAAIIYTDKGDYIICVMMGQLQDPAWGRGVITELSSIVYQYMVSDAITGKTS